MKQESYNLTPNERFAHEGKVVHEIIDQYKNTKFILFIDHTYLQIEKDSNNDLVITDGRWD